VRVGERWSGDRGRGARGKEERSPCLAAHPASVAIPMQGTGSAAGPERQLEQIVVVAAQVPSSPPPLAAGQLAGDCRVERSRTVGPREQVQHNKRWSVLERQPGRQVQRHGSLYCQAPTRQQGQVQCSSPSGHCCRAPAGRQEQDERHARFRLGRETQWHYGPNKGILSPSQSHIHTHPHTQTHTHTHILTKMYHAEARRPSHQRLTSDEAQEVHTAER
jgi:hypothetical protein